MPDRSVGTGSSEWREDQKARATRTLADTPTESLDTADRSLTELVYGAQQGDMDAFEQIFLRFQRRIYNLVYQMVSNEDDASEITQQVFVRAHDSLGRLEHAEAFTTWIHTIATNLCRDHVRRRSHIRTDSLEQRYSGDDDSESTREIPDDSVSPEGILEDAEKHAVIHQAIQSLSENHRAVITLHHLQGMEVVDIAEIMGCRVGTVKSRLARARDELYKKLKDYVLA